MGPATADNRHSELHVTAGVELHITASVAADNRHVDLHITADHHFEQYCVPNKSTDIFCLVVLLRLGSLPLS